MNENTVTLQTKTLKEVFDMNLQIPDYQRIYCWEEKNVYQLLDNIVDIKKPYHLGSIILHKKDNKLSIVDGQQRLVTLSLLINELDENISNNIKLLNEKFESKEAQSYVAYNKYLIKNYIAKRNINQKENFLYSILFSVLIIEDGNLDLAYTFFSNQNSRGKSLTDYDLLKAHHLRFIPDEKQSIHLATRWDNLLLIADDENSDKDIKRTLGLYLFRLRKWAKKREWYDEEKYKVKTEFETAPIIEEIPPFGEKFDFNESIQGGAHFFAYTDNFIYKYRIFTQTKAYQTLQKLDYESHWWFRDVIESLLFGYYLKFGTFYLEEALVCITKIVSKFRYDTSKVFYHKLLKYAADTEILLMIEQASSPTFFLAEALNMIKKYPFLAEEMKGIRLRYNNIEKTIYEELKKNINTEQIKKII